ncbi:hypothetical protein ABLO26_24470 [Neobacillus sp. 179-J 1A1 HS]|uniref:hypothetical protein n=1 Tax=Neobacillus driksii TaxID=3035913 RepID=UPI0035BBD442
MSIRNKVSSIVPWLMEIKKCQMTQLNWKVSTRSWVLHNEEIIEEVMTSARDFFNQRFSFQILKNNSSTTQFLQQGKVNVMGLEITSGAVSNIYGINTTIDADVSKYGTVSAKIENILDEMIRTAMLIHGYYDISYGTIIFASPTLDSSINGQLHDAVKALNEIFKLFGFQFDFELYANDQFTVHILDPLTGQTKDKKVTLKGTKKGAGTVQNQNDERSNFLRIGILVRNEISKFASNNLLSNEMVQNLLDETYCREIFGINFPVLKKFEKDESIAEQIKVNGLKRYWNMSYNINGENYLLCHSWSELHRPKFLKWLELMDEMAK